VLVEPPLRMLPGEPTIGERADLRRPGRDLGNQRRESEPGEPRGLLVRRLDLHPPVEMAGEARQPPPSGGPNRREQMRRLALPVGEQPRRGVKTERGGRVAPLIGVVLVDAPVSADLARESLYRGDAPAIEDR